MTVIERALIALLEAMVKAIGDLAEIFTKNEAWGVVAALLVLIVMQGYCSRRDRLNALTEEHRRDERLGGLLEERNEKLLAAFDKATKMVQVVGALEDRIDVLDKRCDARQRARQHKNKGDQS